jgi:hypothetical protein
LSGARRDTVIGISSVTSFSDLRGDFQAFKGQFLAERIEEHYYSKSKFKIRIFILGFIVKLATFGKGNFLG